jgi:hypothetical protein
MENYKNDKNYSYQDAPSCKNIEKINPLTFFTGYYRTSLCHDIFHRAYAL